MLWRSKRPSSLYGSQFQNNIPSIGIALSGTFLFKLLIFQIGILVCLAP